MSTKRCGTGAAALGSDFLIRLPICNSSSGLLPLTADNIKRLQDQYARVAPLPLEQRVIRWLQSIPMFVGDAQHDVAPDPYAAPPPELPAQRFFEPDDRLRNPNTLLPGDPGDARKDLAQRRPVRAPAMPGVPAGGGTAKYAVPSPAMDRGAAAAAAAAGREDRAKHGKGRLCCYLKVEVSGNTQMLPIHEFDAPKELAYNFCKSNNILGSVDSLTEHITTAIQNYRK
ncbi:hypothetical protein DFJ74DRAFT_659327 [Hyaloraphidium curvatum]|nr:hypothetical protein DFJ74DRAFT_659327 [Hyaloraphidium curvatum]